MCAINGCTGNERELVERMNAVTAHRGPDGTGIYADGSVTLGHNRLAVIDLSDRASQPMQTEDGQLTITYNGELYNYRELRKELVGYPFRSDSDTEVILAAYRTWGRECFARFNGIFALAIWDRAEGELVLARDHMGIKPLYFTWSGTQFLFSSEIKGLLEAGVPRVFNRTAFSDYLRLSDVPGPHTFFAGIDRLHPAHYAVVKNGSMRIARYWDPRTIRAERRSVSAWTEQIQETLDRAVTRQLVSDRPVGVLLSGGIDSSAVLASTLRARGAVRTYTIRFALDDIEDEKFNKDAHLARMTAAHFGTEHTEVTLDEADLIPLFEDAVWHLDEPSGSATALSQLAIARTAVRGVTVVLGGDGGDELFGGYERYRLSRLMDAYQALPRGARSLLEQMAPRLHKLTTKHGMERFAQFEFTKQAEIDRVTAPQYRPDLTTEVLGCRLFSRSSDDFLRSFMDADRELLTDGSLLRSDKLSMAAGLEVRVPILDREMIELAQRIPAECKVGYRSTKRLFKRAVARRLPQYLLEQPKRGWFAPSSVWLRQPTFYAYAREVLSPSYYEGTRGLFDWPGVSDMLDKHREGLEINRTLLWALLSFQLWARRFAITI